MAHVSMPAPVFHTGGGLAQGGAGMSATAAAAGAAGHAGGGMLSSPYVTVPSPQTHAHPPPPSSPMPMPAGSQGIAVLLRTMPGGHSPMRGSSPLSCPPFARAWSPVVGGGQPR